jgi:type I restriction enzyme S subunit
VSSLPEGWVATKLTEVCTLNPAKPKSDQIASDLPVTFVPMAAVDAESGTIANPSIREYSSVAKGFTSFQENDVLMAKITPCMENGKSAIALSLSNGIGFGSTEFHIFRPSAAALPEYVFHFIRQESFRKSSEANMTGSVGQKRVPASFLNEYDFPLPPLAEQRRIVAKLGPLLGSVNAYQQRLVKIPVILKRFRQAVLTAAYAGLLTTDWRANNQTPMPVDDLLRTISDEKKRLIAHGEIKKEPVLPALTEEDLFEVPET